MNMNAHKYPRKYTHTNNNIHHQHTKEKRNVGYHLQKKGGNKRTKKRNKGKKEPNSEQTRAHIHTSVLTHAHTTPRPLAVRVALSLGVKV